ncbi:uncharacterized protein [Eurosta solidaginis]|uniref:uncharacterized protein n=1 Tax=Eurosta solidaginis TaxID=178769 RepID=UPI003530F332
MSQSEEFIWEVEDNKNALKNLKDMEITVSNKTSEHCESFYEDDVKQSYSDEDNEDQCEDPLDNSADDVKVTVFQGEYNEVDFINEVNEDEPILPRHAVIHSRNKRSKTYPSEFISPNGRIWSISNASIKTIVPTDLSFLKLMPKGKGPAAKVKNVLEAWCLLLDERIIATILQYTNEKIHSFKGKLSYQRRTDVVELRAWIGLNYLCGIFRNTAYPGPLNELWTWELGNSIFRATMSWKRFEFLASCISFAAPNNKRGALQCVMLVQDVWERFLANCRSYYAPSGNCIVRDTVINANDNARLTVLCDAKSMYFCNAIISNQMETKAIRERIVLHLVTDIKGSNRNIVLNEEYTSAILAQKLKHRELTLTGALSNESEDVPHALLENETKYKLYSDIGCLISYTATTETPEFLLTTITPGVVAIEQLYKSTNQSWDHLEHVIAAFSTKNAGSETFNNGALNLFYRVMDYAAINAWILLKLSTSGLSSAPTHREFQRDLGLYLTQMHLKRQLHDKNKLTLPQKLQISEVLGEPTDKLLADACEVVKKGTARGFVPTDQLQLPDGLILRTRELERRKRCCICIKYQTRTRCQQCLRAYCHRHLIVRCNDCMGVTELPDP